MDRTGRIYWLPERDELTTTQLHGTNVPKDGFHHPVLILQTHGDVHIVLLLTSFDRHDVLARHPTRSKPRRRYIPIHPSPRHPDTGELLHLARGTPKLRKDSYINISHKRRIRADALAPYDRRSGATYRLEDDSWKLLLRRLGMPYAPLSLDTRAVIQARDPVDLAAAQRLQQIVQVAANPSRTTYADAARHQQRAPPQHQQTYHYGTIGAGSAASVLTAGRRSERNPVRPVGWVYNRPAYLEEHRSSSEAGKSSDPGKFILFCVVVAAVYGVWRWAMK